MESKYRKGHAASSSSAVDQLRDLVHSDPRHNNSYFSLSPPPRQERPRLGRQSPLGNLPRRFRSGSSPTTSPSAIEEDTTSGQPRQATESRKVHEQYRGSPLKLSAKPSGRASSAPRSSTPEYGSPLQRPSRVNGASSSTAQQQDHVRLESPPPPRHSSTRHGNNNGMSTLQRRSLGSNGHAVASSRSELETNTEPMHNQHRTKKNAQVVKKWEHALEEEKRRAELRKREIRQSRLGGDIDTLHTVTARQRNNVPVDDRTHASTARGRPPKETVGHEACPSSYGSDHMQAFTDGMPISSHDDSSDQVAEGIHMAPQDDFLPNDTATPSSSENTHRTDSKQWADMDDNPYHMPSQMVCTGPYDANPTRDERVSHFEPLSDHSPHTDSSKFRKSFSEVENSPILQLEKSLDHYSDGSCGKEEYATYGWDGSSPENETSSLPIEKLAYEALETVKEPMGQHVFSGAGSDYTSDDNWATKSGKQPATPNGRFTKIRAGQKNTVLDGVTESPQSSPKLYTSQNLSQTQPHKNDEDSSDEDSDEENLRRGILRPEQLALLHKTLIRGDGGDQWNGPRHYQSPRKEEDRRTRSRRENKVRALLFNSPIKTSSPSPSSPASLRVGDAERPSRMSSLELEANRRKREKETTHTVGRTNENQMPSFAGEMPSFGEMDSVVAARGTMPGGQSPTKSSRGGTSIGMLLPSFVKHQKDDRNDWSDFQLDQLLDD